MQSATRERIRIVSVIQFNLATQIAQTAHACCRLSEYNYNQGLQGSFLTVVLATCSIT